MVCAGDHSIRRKAEVGRGEELADLLAIQFTRQDGSESILRYIRGKVNTLRNAPAAPQPPAAASGPVSAPAGAASARRRWGHVAAAAKGTKRTPSASARVTTEGRPAGVRLAVAGAAGGGVAATPAMLSVPAQVGPQATCCAESQRTSASLFEGADVGLSTRGPASQARAAVGYRAHQLHSGDVIFVRRCEQARSPHESPPQPACAALRAEALIARPSVASLVCSSVVVIAALVSLYSHVDTSRPCM